MKKYFIGMSLAFILFSCNENDGLFNDNEINEVPIVSDVIVNENGFLDFKSFNALEQIVKDIEAGQALGISASTTLTRAISDNQFLSVAMLRDDIDGGGGYLSPLPTPYDDLEEMTIHEYRLMKAEDLLLDNVLAEVLDTTLRIGVNDRIYKITDYGTFSAPRSNLSLMEREIANFNPLLISSKEAGETINLTHIAAYPLLIS